MKTQQQSSRNDIYAEITNQIVADLEKGVRPWMKSWSMEHQAGPISRPLRHNGEAYRGINTIMLWSTAMDRGYAAPIWMTYDQAKKLGGQVKRREKSTSVVYASSVTKTEIDEETGEEIDVEIPFMRGYRVFNVEQIADLPGDYYAVVEQRLDPAERLQHAEAFFKNLKADIRIGGNRAFYRPSDDFVQMPPFEAFESAESYYATLGHECALD